MFAPGSGSSGDSEDYRDNPKSGNITFKREKGHINIYNAGRKVGGSKAVSGRLNEMANEVKRAEAGHRGVAHHDHGSRAYGTQSSFPGFYKSVGFQNKADFARVIHAKEGVKFSRLVDTAIGDLNHGYHHTQGDVMPNRNFQVRTKQVFDNRGGIRWVMVHGRPVPIRGK